MIEERRTRRRWKCRN